MIRRFGVCSLLGGEILILTALTLATRCANYRDVFVAGSTYFTDADCYARMTRVRICAEHPGSVVRHHVFENYPAGTTPHTTAPLDYLIVALYIPLRPFTGQALDLAGALVSPMLAVLTAWFLWWWLKRMRFRYRWAALILYVISPMLVHGTELGRPDHQSLLLLLFTLAICAEWAWQTEPLTGWNVLSGVAWSLAIWVSAYEPLLLLLLLLVFGLLQNWVLRRESDSTGAAMGLSFFKRRRIGLLFFAAIIALAMLIERRVPTLPIFTSTTAFRNWSHTIGELASVSPLSPLWFRWAGYIIVIAPILIWLAFRQNAIRGGEMLAAEPSGGEDRPAALTSFILVFVVATYGLTIWQARWGYFFMLTFTIMLPALLQRLKLSVTVWAAFTLAIFPILRAWDQRLWPNEAELAQRIESRNESTQLRDLSISLESWEILPFLAPWWLSPSIAYWSGQPGVAGSSHESLSGITDSARFFLSEDLQKARQIVENHKVSWVIAYDADRTADISALILGEAVPEHALCYVLQRAPAQAPRFLVFSAQNATAKLFRVSPVASNP